MKYEMHIFFNFVFELYGGKAVFALFMTWINIMMVINSLKALGTQVLVSYDPLPPPPCAGGRI